MTKATRRTDRTRKPEISKGFPPARRAWAPAFLAALERSGSVRLAARLAGIGRSTAYDHRERNAEFATAWEAAADIGRRARQIYTDGVCPRCGRTKPGRRSP
jgi:hypothetical protein